jgi:multidrug efflux pump subunit AcrB
MTCALVASRLVSMTFIPFLGYYLLRPTKKREESVEERRTRGFTGFYYRAGKFAIEHRWLVFAGSLLFLVAGGYFGHQLKTQFFPDDVQYLSFADIWLPNDAPLFVTNQTAMQVEDVIRATAEKYRREHPGKDGQPRPGFRNLALVMAVSIGLIFLALAFQFKHAVKPILVLAAAPYGVVGALIALYVMGASFGFMAFLGIASLIGVIVSHVIVLFDFIEEMHEKGEPLELALLDAGIVRLRPVMINRGRDNPGAVSAGAAR